MGFRLDRYSYQAEALPTLLVIVPLAFLAAAIMPEGMSLREIALKFSPFVAIAALAFIAVKSGLTSGREWKDAYGTNGADLLLHAFFATETENTIIDPGRLFTTV